MNQKIFVLDDDENSCKLAATALNRAGYEVQTQCAAIGATSAIKSFAPDLILLDVMMPALSGDTMVEILDRAIKPRPRILFYSNKSAHDLRDLTDKTGVEGYVCKLDGPSALLATVRRVLGQ
jgi:DNA-binding response OmpR family regulator